MADRDPKPPTTTADLFTALKDLPMPAFLAGKQPPNVGGSPAKKPVDLAADQAQQTQQSREQEHEPARLRRVEAQVQQLIEERDRLAKERDWYAGERAALLAERERLVAEHDRLEKERDELRAERDRLAAEQRALRSARRELPRTAGELRAWREERGLNQVEAARQLQVGSATVARAEAKGPETPLGRVLRLALARDAAAVREAAKGAVPAVQAKKKKRKD